MPVALSDGFGGTFWREEKQMIRNEQAGISCSDCGHEEIVNTARMRDHLIEILSWHECGDPVCPSCGALLTFEDYLPDTDRNAPAVTPNAK